MRNSNFLKFEFNPIKTFKINSTLVDNNVKMIL